MTIRICIPADPQTKGGGDHPAHCQGRPGTHQRKPAGSYRTFGELEAACRQFCEQANDRPHRETRCPLEALTAEPTVHCRVWHHPPVSWDATISVEGVRYLS